MHSHEISDFEGVQFDRVLILVVMEDALARDREQAVQLAKSGS